MTTGIVMAANRDSSPMVILFPGFVGAYFRYASSLWVFFYMYMYSCGFCRDEDGHALQNNFNNQENRFFSFTSVFQHLSFTLLHTQVSGCNDSL